MPGPPAPAGWRSRIAGQVAEFHRGFQLPLRTSPTVEVGADQLELRLDLIEEEVAELRAAAMAGDLTGIADALADIVYVAYGTAHVYGIGLDAVMDEVHSSNMTKLGADGRPVRRADGKILKGPAYRAPDVAAVLRRQVDERYGVDVGPVLISTDGPTATRRAISWNHDHQARSVDEEADHR